MGAQIARGLKEMIDEGTASLEMAMHVHLRSNFYPPIPSRMVPVAVKAIIRTNRNNSTRIQLPNGVLYKGERYISPAACIREFRLREFLDDPDNPDDEE